MRRCDHPVLHQLLRKVIQDERRHFAFYRAQAKARMQRSHTARRLVRWALSNLWTPVGAGVKSEQEVDALAIYLFGDGPEGREQLREIDRTISDIPGLEGLTILRGLSSTRRFAGRPSARAGPDRRAPAPAPTNGNGQPGRPATGRTWARERTSVRYLPSPSLRARSSACARPRRRPPPRRPASGPCR